MKSFTVDGVTLIYGDCRDVLPTIAPGAVYITDPVWPNVPAGLIPGSDRPFELFAETMESLVEPKRLVVVMRTDSDPKILYPVPPELQFLRTIELPYAVPARHGRILMGGDIAYVYGPAPAWDPEMRLLAGRAPAAQPTPKAIGHPCPRPQLHADWLVDRLSDQSDLIVDPFVGSGTLAISALKLRRRFVGIEIDEGFFDLACRRLEEAAGQVSMDFSKTIQPRRLVKTAQPSIFEAC